jgi:uncharacterized SAM-binding protein YcdF (DUF218 family)
MTDPAARRAARAAADARNGRRGGGGSGTLGQAVGGLLFGAVLGVLVWIALADLTLQLAPASGRLVALAVSVVLGTLLGALGRLRALGLLAGAVAVLYLVVAFTPLVAGPARALVRRDPAMSDSLAVGATVDAVVAMSGAVSASGLVAGQGVERLLDAVAWARRTGRPLVVSVTRRFGTPDATSSLGDQQRLAALAGLAPPIALDSVHTTHDEAVRLAAFARTVGWRRVLVVTSPLHARRACATIERAGLRVVCAPSASRELDLEGRGALGGARERVRAFSIWAYETAGWLEYRLRDWV